VDELGERLEQITEPNLLMLALINRGTALAWRGRYRAGAEDLEQASRVASAHGFDYAVLHCLSHLAGVASAESDYPRMQRVADAALNFARERSLDSSSASCFAYIIAAWAAYQFLDHERAHALAPLAVQRLATSNDRTVETAAVSVAAAVDFERDADTHAVLVRLRRHWATLSRNDPVQPAMVAYVAAVEQRMALRLGRPDWAAEAERRASAWLGDAGDALLLRARMHAHYGRVAASRNLLEKITKGHSQCHVVSSRIEAHLLAAALAGRAGDHRNVNLELRAAIELAEPRRAVRPFYEAGQEIRQLVATQLSRLGRLDPFVEEILGAIPAESQGVTAELTPREMQLLGELPTLATIEEIAGSPYESVNTVKTHLRKVLPQARGDLATGGRDRGAATWTLVASIGTPFERILLIECSG
jgi:LuxR family maltose regulon positive regulatory protein